MAELVAEFVVSALLIDPHLPTTGLMREHRKPRLLRKGLAANRAPLFAPWSLHLTAQLNTKPRGRQFFNNPGPTNIPDSVLRAMDRPVMDFLAPEFLEIHRACHGGVKRILKTDQEIF